MFARTQHRRIKLELLTEAHEVGGARGNIRCHRSLLRLKRTSTPQPPVIVPS
jgi:hypothetical protein